MARSPKKIKAVDAMHRVQAKHIASLKATYKTEAARLSKLMKGIKRGSSQSRANQAARRVLYERVQHLDDFALRWAQEAIPESADIARNVFANLLGRPIEASPDLVKAIGAQVDLTASDLMRANHDTVATFERWVRVSQQTEIPDVQFTDLAVEGRLQGASKEEVAQAMYDRMAEQVGDAKFISINGRNYGLDSYTELVAITRTTEIASTASISTSLSAGIDLVEFSEHEGSCPVCQEHEHAVYSLSGEDEDHDELTEEDTPPLHPRCTHRLLPFGSGAQEEDV